MSAWQPIETLLDGIRAGRVHEETVVLAIFEGGAMNVVRLRYLPEVPAIYDDDGNLEEHSESEEFWFSIETKQWRNEGIDLMDWPTHWMPLPEAPA